MWPKLCKKLNIWLEVRSWSGYMWYLIAWLACYESDEWWTHWKLYNYFSILNLNLNYTGSYKIIKLKTYNECIMKLWKGKHKGNPLHFFLFVIASWLFTANSWWGPAFTPHTLLTTFKYSLHTTLNSPVDFYGGRRTGEPRKKTLSEALGRESTTNSTHIWHQAQESN
jgi:hypothetical protein